MRWTVTIAFLLSPLVLWACLAPGGALEDSTISSDSPCAGQQLLAIPLTSPEEHFEAVAPSGHVVVAIRDGTNWAVLVYAPGDSNREDDLLAPVGDWNGRLASDVWPEVEPILYPSTRSIVVRSTDHRVCLHLHDSKVIVAPPGPERSPQPARFESGTLIITWQAGDARHPGLRWRQSAS